MSPFKDNRHVNFHVALYYRSDIFCIHQSQQKVTHHKRKLNFSSYIYDENICDVTQDLYPSPVTNCHTFFEYSCPWSMTYFTDGPGLSNYPDFSDLLVSRLGPPLEYP